MKNIVYKLLKPISFIIREIKQRNLVTIVLFHNPSLEKTKLIYKFYDKFYNIIDLEQYLKAKKDSTLNSLPKKSLIITFDDGWRGNYELLEVFQKYQVKPTIFLTTGLIDVHEKFLTKDKLLQMQKYVNFESHTVTHPNMLKINNIQLKKELSESKKYLETLLKRDINIFAYPFGKYNNQHIPILQQSGYRYALTVDLGFNTINQDNYKIKRICISDLPTIDELYIKSTGIWQFLKQIIKRKKDENPSLL
ncbi:MAG: polysaccharide deacetylase family protein [Sulfurovaceae bacterium]|nr:polysaccharide deacetylase family protein [Sulfurovaceae bacterium]